LFGHAVGFLFVMVAGRVDRQLRLQTAHYSLVSDDGPELEKTIHGRGIQPRLHPSLHCLVSEGLLPLNNRMGWSGGIGLFHSQ
jgi:hypothetical protein